MSLRRPTAAGIATKQGLLDVLTGLYDRIEKPSGGNLTEFITTVVTQTGGPLATRRVDTTAPLAGGGPLSGDLTLSLGIDGTLQVTGGLLGLAPLAPNPQSIGSSLALVQELDTDAFGRVTGGTAINIGATLSNNAGTLDVAQLFDDTVMLGDLLALQRAAPGTPSANLGRIWFDSTAKNFLGINEGATKTAMVEAITAPAHQFLTGVSLAGVWTSAQPAYTDISGSVPAITQLTGDVTAGPGSGSQAATIGSNKVTYAKMQQASAVTLLGNPTGSTANVSEITLGSGLAFSGTTLISTVSGGITQLTGDVTAGPGSGSQAATIGANKVTYAKIQQETPGTILGNPGASPANVQELFLGGGLEFATVPSRVQRSALTGDVTAPAGSNATTLATVIVPATYGGGGAYIISETVDAKGRATAFSTTTTPLASSLSWQMNQSGISIGPDLSTVVLPADGGSAIFLAAATSTPISTTLAANYGSSSSSPPTYPFRVAWQKAVVAVDVGATVTSGTGSAILQFELWAVTGNPATPGNWTQLGSTAGMNISGGATSFQTLGFTVNSIAANSSLVLLARRSDLNSSITITTLAFQATCSLGQ